VVSVVALIIVAGILLVVLKANPSNSIVSQVHDWARWLAGPFDGIFSFRNARVAISRLLSGVALDGNHEEEFEIAAPEFPGMREVYRSAPPLRTHRGAAA